MPAGLPVMAKQKMERESQKPKRLPAIKDNQRKPNTTKNQRGASDDIQMNSGNRRPVCIPAFAKSTQISNTNISGNTAAPHALNVDERLRVVRERREERERQLVSKELGWQAREERARRYYEEHMEERKRRLLEQRGKEERRRHAVEEKRKQRLKEEKERNESAVRKTLEKSQRATQRPSQNSQGKKLTKNNAQRCVPLSPWEKSLVSRLLTPTCSYLARSKSAGCQSQEEVAHVCRRSVPCHSVKAAAPHKAQHPSGPADQNTIRNIHRTINLAQMKAEQMERNVKKLCSGRPPQTGGSNSRAKPTNPPNRPAAPPPKQSQNKPVIRHVNTPKQVDLSPVPEEDAPAHPLSRSRGNSRAVTMPAVSYQEHMEEREPSGNPYPNSPEPRIAIRTEGGETPPPGVTRPSAGTMDPEEASRLLAEKRREARQQREREEEERLRREEAERRSREELERRRAEQRARQDAQRLTEERKKREEEEEKQAQAEEARRAAEEAALLQAEREEELARQQEKAEQLRLEREKVFQKEEAERQARKKRLELIMRRTRKSDPGDQKPAPTENLVEEAKPNGNTERAPNGTTAVGMRSSQPDSPGVEDAVPVVAFKERRSLRSLSGLEEIQAHHRAEVI